MELDLKEWIWAPIGHIKEGPFFDYLKEGIKLSTHNKRRLHVSTLKYQIEVIVHINASSSIRNYVIIRSLKRYLH